MEGIFTAFVIAMITILAAGNALLLLFVMHRYQINTSGSKESNPFRFLAGSAELALSGVSLMSCGHSNSNRVNTQQHLTR
jgi:hypothetical protein